MKASELMASAPAPAEPVLVYTGPTRTGAALVAAVAADADQQAASKPRGKKSRVAKKSDAAGKRKDAGKDTDKDVKPAAKPNAKSTDGKSDGKPAAPRRAAAKHEAAAKPVEKPAASGDQKPAKPKAATKPAKPANNS